MPSHKQRSFFFALEDEASKRAKALHTKPWPPDRALANG